MRRFGTAVLRGARRGVTAARTAASRAATGIQDRRQRRAMRRWAHVTALGARPGVRVLQVLEVERSYRAGTVAVMREVSPHGRTGAVVRVWTERVVHEPRRGQVLAVRGRLGWSRHLNEDDVLFVFEVLAVAGRGTRAPRHPAP